MCHGDPSIELLEASGKRLAVIGVHHGQGIRWDAWRDDADLVEGRSLLEWIASQGASYPLETYEEDMRQREIAKADRIRWLEAMPACLKPFVDQTKDGRAMLDALAQAHSDESERVLVLLAWFGSGAGRWNGYPGYEQDAQALLMTFPIEHLLTALDSSELIGARLEGAARFFASWEFRTKRAAELSRLPESVKRALLEHSLQSTDPDKRARAQKAFGWVM